MLVVGLVKAESVAKYGTCIHCRIVSRMCGNLEAIEIVRGGSGERRVIMFRVTPVTMLGGALSPVKSHQATTSANSSPCRSEYLNHS